MSSNLRDSTAYLHILGDSGNNVLHGSSGDDFISGLDGNDTLYGHDGNDVLDGGGWHDLLDGGSGSDWVLYDLNTTSLLIDLEVGLASFPGSGWVPETLISIENAETGSGNDTLIGSAAANELRGGAGDDLLLGGGGNDRLFGDDGNDTLDGGSWNDLIDGGAGQDMVLYDTNTSSVVIDLEAGLASFPGTGWGGETLVSIEDARTGSGNDTLIGSNGDNRFWGGSGADFLTMGDGVNVARGGGGNDTLIGGRAAIDDTLFLDDLAGGSGNDLIVSGGAILKEPGPIMFWSAGDDTLSGGSGSDTLVGGPGNMHMTGGQGADEFRFTNETALIGGGPHAGMVATWAEITDFDPGEGDSIVFEITDNPEGHVPLFAGETPEIGDFVLGWQRSGGDTVLAFTFTSSEGEPYYSDDFVACEVVLRNYSGAVSQNDIFFV